MHIQDQFYEHVVAYKVKGEKTYILANYKDTMPYTVSGFMGISSLVVSTIPDLKIVSQDVSSEHLMVFCYQILTICAVKK